MVMERVAIGALSTGDRIPSVREYAANLEVNANTVMRSYEFLEKTGVISNRRGIGFFIADNAKSASLQYFSHDLFDRQLPQLFHRMKTIGVTDRQIVQLYNEYQNQTK